MIWENTKSYGKIIAVLTVVALVGIMVGTAFSGNLGTEEASAEATLTELTSLASTASDLESPFKTVYEQASQSVVGIKLTAQISVRNGRISTDTSYVGSGVVISDSGYVVTNYHVVNPETNTSSMYGMNQSKTTVESILVVYDGKDYVAEYVAGDEDSDIAILKVDGLNAPAAKIGNSDELSVGDWALVIGNPLGESFENTLTVGVISGLDRQVSTSSSKGSSSATSMIQTNAAVNSGNSGGGLFNIKGELVGITSMKLSNNGSVGSASIEGIGFAIPINTVSEIADSLIEYGEVKTPSYPRLGVSVEDIKEGAEEPSKEKLPLSVLIRSVEANSPAEKAGIKVYDLIMEVDGERVKTYDELSAILRTHEEGDVISVTVYRIPNLLSVRSDEDIPEGEYITFEVTLEILDS